MAKFSEGMEYFRTLPEQSLSKDEILDKLDGYLELGHYNWKDGFVSGAVYNYDEETINLITEVYGRSSYTNPLHNDVFPGVNKMEAEVIRMVANLFNGGPDACGSMTTGGTGKKNLLSSLTRSFNPFSLLPESIMMACKAYRDYARDVKGIEHPNIVASITAHSAFDKSAQYLNFNVRSIKVDPVTTEVDLKAMEKAINKNTIMVFKIKLIDFRN